MAKLTAKVTFRQNEIPENEKKDRVRQFQQAVTLAAVGYYSDKIEKAAMQ